jgi:hypothetical protein
MKKPFLVFIVIIMLALTNTPSNVGAVGRSPVKGTCVNQSVLKLKYPMQELWIEHAWWTRSYIVSNLAGIKDQKDVLARLLKNQDDIGNLIKPYYGVEAGNKLTALLKEHILIAGKIIDAAKKGDQKNLDLLNKEWYRNADQIVSFLTSANPNWSKQVLTDMFYTHLKLTTTEVVDRLKGNWVADIKTADTNEDHLIHLGDILTDGIVKQFPKKFK